jgi:hypothetical protein
MEAIVVLRVHPLLSQGTLLKFVPEKRRQDLVIRWLNEFLAIRPAYDYGFYPARSPSSKVSTISAILKPLVRSNRIPLLRCNIPEEKGF